MNFPSSSQDAAKSGQKQTGNTHDSAVSLLPVEQNLQSEPSLSGSKQPITKRGDKMHGVAVLSSNNVYINFLKAKLCQAHSHFACTHDDNGKLAVHVPGNNQASGIFISRSLSVVKQETRLVSIVSI